MAYRLGRGTFDAHIYYPWDRRLFTARALDSLKPAAFITAETELWPNMLWECGSRGIPAFLINGRISDRTNERISGMIAGRLAKEAYSLYTHLYMRSEEDAERLRAVGVPGGKLSVMGDSKTDALIARKDENMRRHWQELFGSPERPIFIAGSTHTGEDEIAYAAFETVRKSVPGARLIIAPRHPERAARVKALAPEGLKTALLSEYQEGWDALIIDSIGVLFELYGTARAAFVGGSFADKGGQNILEPFLWGTPVQFGPHTEDFAQAARAFISMGAARRVNGEDELAEAWTAAADGKASGRLAGLSREYFGASRGASARAWDAVKNILQSRTEAERQ